MTHAGVPGGGDPEKGKETKMRLPLRNRACAGRFRLERLAIGLLTVALVHLSVIGNPLGPPPPPQLF